MFLKLNNNSKFPIQVNVNERVQNPGESDTQQYFNMKKYTTVKPSFTK